MPHAYYDLSQFDLFEITWPFCFGLIGLSMFAAFVLV